MCEGLSTSGGIGLCVKLENCRAHGAERKPKTNHETEVGWMKRSDATAPNDHYRGEDKCRLR